MIELQIVNGDLLESSAEAILLPVDGIGSQVVER
jgi:hypothetical protein